MPMVYDRFARFYDLEYSLKEDDLPFYLDLADRFPGPLLEIGAGTGRVTLELAAAGSEIWGIDDSARMLAVAEKKMRGIEAAGRVHLVQADMRDFTLPVKFALCIIPFRAFLHNLTQADQLATLAAIRRHLKPGGILGLEDHRGRNDRPQDPKAESGYVRQDYAIALVKRAGFAYVRNNLVAFGHVLEGCRRHGRDP